MHKTTIYYDETVAKYVQTKRVHANYPLNTNVTHIYELINMVYKDCTSQPDYFKPEKNSI